jgi:membrane protein implicated in regulation of membrane protease activity
MLTKQEWCGLTLLGCVIGLAGAAITIAALWAMVYRPFWFWLVMIAAIVNLLLGFLVGWVYEWRARRRTRRKTIYGCLHCGQIFKTLHEYQVHRCVVRRERKMEGEL